MANTYTLIASNTLGSSAASVTFSAIPNTYTDLVVRWSARGATGLGNNIDFRINGLTTTVYSRIYLLGDGASASSSLGPDETSADMRAGYNPSNATASTFNSGEIYLPSYTASQNKPIGSFNVTENNGTTAYIGANANLFRNTSAITSVSIAAASGNLASGSTFWLYGIKNS
jgi:hypothetical protein